LVDSLLAGKSEQAIMAMKDSIAGPIIPKYALIDKNNLHLEHYLNIHQNLMALKGQKNRRYSGSTFASDGIITMYGFLEKISQYQIG
jgi:prephenate dehydratase